MEAGGAALVSGAGRGLGRALALALARRGFEVTGTVRDPDVGRGLADEAEAEGLDLRWALLDVRDPGAFQAPEGLRVLVNNAGSDTAYLPVEEADPDAWRRLFEVNLFGALELTRRALPRLRAAGGGVVCNITSAGLLHPMPFFSAYRASKAALSALGESLRSEVAALGIRVIEILPGPIRTDMLSDSSREPEAAAFAPYRALAARAHAGRLAVEGRVERAEVAAARIVDVVLDDEAPLRNACDPLGEALLAGWRSQDDESWMRPLLAGLGALPPGENGDGGEEPGTGRP